MLFLNLDHQLFLILVLVFSSYIFFNAFFIPSIKTGLRVFGLAFSLPLFLSIISFLTAPYHKSTAQNLLIFAHLILILLCTIILFIRQESDSLKLFYILPFILIGAVLFLANINLDLVWYGIFHFIDLALVLLNLALVVHTLFHKEKERLYAYLGLFMISAGLGMWFLSSMLSLETLLLMSIGYIACTLYLYKNTLSVFFKEYKKNTEALNRMNASIHTEVIKRVEHIERSNRKLLEIAKTDSLTGLYTKTVILKNLEAALERSPQTTLSVLMFDIDKFKNINDSMGHQVGDRCIKTLSNLIQASFRSDDILGRYGGDEFMVLLPATPPVKAYLIADRFRQIVQSKSSPQITISVGISNYPEDGKSAALLVEEADKALYASKLTGRNSVTLYSSLNKE